MKKVIGYAHLLYMVQIFYTIFFFRPYFPKKLSNVPYIENKYPTYPTFTFALT